MYSVHRVKVMSFAKENVTWIENFDDREKFSVGFL